MCSKKVHLISSEEKHKFKIIQRLKYFIKNEEKKNQKNVSAYSIFIFYESLTPLKDFITFIPFNFSINFSK